MSLISNKLHHISNEFITGGIHKAFLVDNNGDLKVFIPEIHSTNMYEIYSPGESFNINSSKLLEKFNILPEPMWNVPNEEAMKHETPIHPCWVIFENNSIQRPVIMGWCGDGIMYHASNSDSSGGQSGYYNSNGTFISTNNSSDAPVTYNDQGKIDYSNWIYPLESRHTMDPNTGSRNFGANRSNGNRAHAGIDLIVPPGVKVKACTDGLVKYISYGFYGGTDAILVNNTDGSWITYGECRPSVSVGAKIKKGDIIGTIIANNIGGSSMLHFETYVGDEDGHPLTYKGGKYKYVPQRTYKRREDLYDPTFVINLK